MEEIKNINKKIADCQNELNSLENKDVLNKNSIVAAEDKLKNLKENFTEDVGDSTLKKNIKTAETELNSLEEHHIAIKTQISEKSDDINELDHKKDELIRRCLMKLHADMKKKYRKVSEDHDRYVDLYTKAREEQHSIERKMRNLKVLVYKNYKIRLV